MKKPVDREKRWLKEKGCKNVARMWREDMNMWVVVPMKDGVEMKYVTPEWEPHEVALGRVKKIVFKSSPEQKARWQALKQQTPHK